LSSPFVAGLAPVAVVCFAAGISRISFSASACVACLYGHDDVTISPHRMKKWKPHMLKWTPWTSHVQYPSPVHMPEYQGCTHR
jgi:hypothetical protein